MAHQVLGGSVPFHDEALFYRVHMLDVVRAVKHAIDHDVVGTVQPHARGWCRRAWRRTSTPSAPSTVCPADLPQRASAPTVPVSVDRLLATGFVFEHTEVESMPAEDAAPAPREVPEVDRSGRELVTAVLERVVRELGVVEQTGADGDAALPLHAVRRPPRRHPHRRGAHLHPRGTACSWCTACWPSTSSAWTPTSSTQHAGRQRAAPVPRHGHLAQHRRDRSTSGSTSRRGSTSGRASTTSTPSHAADRAARRRWLQPGILPVPLDRSAPVGAALAVDDRRDRRPDRPGARPDHGTSTSTAGWAWSARACRPRWSRASPGGTSRRDQLARAAMFSARTNPVWTLLDRLGPTPPPPCEPPSPADAVPD